MADTITTWTPISAPTDFRDDAVFDIDTKTKSIQVLVEQPIVAGENKSQFIKFQMGRYYDAIDLTAMQVNIVFLSPAGNRGISAAVNTEYSDDAFRFGWLVPYEACPEKGKLYFAVEFVGADYTLKTTAGCTNVLDSISDRDIVPEPVEQEWYIVLQANVATLMQEAQRALGKVEGIFNALGTPMTADTAAEMVEESAIYVYTGSETGYTYGNWYYYDGTEWVSGGAYASTALTVDATLTQEGQAADAKKTGDEITSLKTYLSETIAEEQVPETLELVANEYVGGDGTFKPSSNWSRTGYIEVTPGQTITIVAPASSQYNVSYDTNKAMVGSKWSVSSGENTRTLGATVKYIVLSGTTANMQRTTLYLGSKRINLKSTLPLTETMSEDVDERITKAIQPIQINRIISPTAYLMKQQIPNYYFSRNDTPLDKHDIGYLDDKINSIPDGYHFLFVTDTHWNDNAMQSPKLISYVKDRIGAPYVLFGGDILTAYRTEAEAYRWMCDFMSDFKNAFGNNFLPVVGNHDLNNTNASDPSLMYSDLVPIFTQGCDSRFHYCDFYDDRIDELAVSKGMTDAEVVAMKQYFRTCYYVDDNEGKVRFIVYNTGAGDGGSGIRQYIDNYVKGSYEEMLVMQWVYDVLMHTPDGYNVILSTHIPGDFSWSTGGNTILSEARKKFAAMVAGLKLKKRVTVPMPAGISDYSWWGSGTLYFDYTNAPDVGIVAVIGGHTHVDTFGKYGFYNQNYNASAMNSVQGDINGTSFTCYQSSTEYEEGVKWISEVPIILTQHDAYTKNSGPNSHAMELGTITEQVFDVVTIRPNGDIALTRFGAGNDRYLTIV